MAGRCPVAVATLFLASLLPGTVEAFGGPYSSRGYAVSSVPYCYVIPARPLPSAAPAYAYPALVPVPRSQEPLAVPVPAPPSQTSEPPLSNPQKPAVKALSGPRTEGKGPTIVESRSQEGARTSTGPYKVGFWNLTGKDVALTVDGKVQSLPRDRAVTLEVNRQFVWQIDRETPRTERVPDDQSGHEVVIRP